MYIQPNTVIKILENIPLNKTYEHTVFYSDKDKQFEAFDKYTKYTLQNYSYVRYSTGIIRVEIEYEKLYNCNYLMFKNSSFENKWFYAFITGATYISNSVTELYFELDEMQTWCYDYDFGLTFVERQHATSDKPYENTQPEGLELGPDYVYEKSHGISLTEQSQEKITFILTATTTQTGGKPSANVLNGSLFSLYTATVTGITAARQLVQGFIDNGYEDNIISIYTVPDSTKANQSLNFKRNNDLDGYVPKNKKLYCYPFTFLTLYNNTGEEIELKYENFITDNGAKNYAIDNDIKFQIISFTAPVPQSKCLPINYMGTGASLLVNSVTYSQFPTGAFAGDSFKVWLAQNKNSYAASLNAIGNSFDTNIQNSMLSFAQATRNAENANAITKNSIKSSVTEASANYNLQYGGKDSVFGQQKKASVTSSTAGSVSSIVGGNSAAAATNTANLAISTTANENIMGDIFTAQLNSAQRTAAVNYNNADLALANARENAATAQASTALSALTTAQNATSALVAKRQDAAHSPTNLHGAMMSDTWNGALGLVGFTIWERSIRYEYAKIIDQYFEKYGYSQRNMYKPVRLNRPHWSFLKTTGTNITGKLNNTDLTIIKTIYENGVTTWDSLENVGNYNLDNGV